MQPQPAEKMTDSATPDPTVGTAAFPDPAVIVDPAVANGQCEQADTQQQQQQQPGTESQGGGLKMDQEMKITDSIEDRGRRSKLRVLCVPVRNAAESSELFCFCFNCEIKIGAGFPAAGQKKILISCSLPSISHSVLKLDFSLKGFMPLLL